MKKRGSLFSRSSQSKEGTHTQEIIVECGKFCDKRKHGAYESSLEMHRTTGCRPMESWRE